MNELHPYDLIDLIRTWQHSRQVVQQIRIKKRGYDSLTDGNTNTLFLFYLN
jgi:hypothetical protein